MGMTIIFLTFVVCAIMGFLREDLRRSTLQRSKEEWTVDLIGLFIQGVFIPAFPFLILPILSYVAPDFDHIIEIDPFIQFVLSFVVVDYLYYWNHRIFHSKNFWHIHRLHHSARHLDVLATSRNSLFTSFLFVYVWVQIAALYLLKDSTPFLLGLAFTFALDLWRHSGLDVHPLVRSLFGWVLILPEQHVLHHSVAGRTKNYGANIVWWDKFHGTYSANTVRNANLEKLNEKNYWQELLLPRKAGK